MYRMRDVDDLWPVNNPLLKWVPRIKVLGPFDPMWVGPVAGSKVVLSGLSMSENNGAIDDIVYPER